MPLEPGGYADKLGNRYEGRWVVRQLLRVLGERLRSVTCEVVGDDEHGVDLRIEYLDGVRQDQQCKIRNVSKNHWSLADLDQRGILTAMKGHLDRGLLNQFALVTPLPAFLLHDICESARNSSGDPEEFFAHQIEAIGDKRRKAFRQFCERLGLNAQSQNDRARAFSYLQRLFIETWPDTGSSREDVVGQAGMLVRVDPDGDPSTVVAVLADFAHENLRKRLDALTIWKYLESKGFHPRQLSYDTRLVPRIQTLQRQFAESISGDLIAGKLIHRAETQKILDSLNDNAIVVLHGRPGQGKSGVLYDLTSHFETHDITYLPLRLDRQEPQKTARQYGADLELRESPVICLSEVALDRPAVLILDQLDAIRWTSRHSVCALEVCKELLREIKYLRTMGKHASVVLACRTYDMQNDPDIKNWLQSEKQTDATLVEIAVEPLSAEAVAGVVASLGQNPNQMSERQRTILRSPQHLAMWVRITHEVGTFEFQNRVQLMRAYWEGRMREMARWRVSESDANRVLASIVTYCDHHGRISAPRSLVVETTVLDALCASGLLRANDGQITFSHQSYLDYQIASCVVRQINADDQSISIWLGPRERQSLHRREQLRQALCLLNEESPDNFLATVKTILDSGEVRFHFKHLCLEVIGQLEHPPVALLEYLKGLVALDDWKEHVLGTVLIAHTPFVAMLIDDGTVTAWLDMDEWRDHALWMLRGLAEVAPDKVAAFLAPYGRRGREWRTRVLSCLPWSPGDDSDSIFALRLELARQGVFQEYVDWQKLAGHRALQLLEAMVSCWVAADLQKDDADGAVTRRARCMHWTDRDEEALLRAAREFPERAWALLMPHVSRLAPRPGGHARAPRVWLDGDPHGTRQGNACIPHVLARSSIESGKCLARQDGAAFWKRTAKLRSHKSLVMQYVLIEAYSGLPPQLADDAIEWLMGDGARLRIGTGEYEPEWMPAVRMIEALSPHCSPAIVGQLEKLLIHYHSPNERREAEYYLVRSRRGLWGDYWGRAQHFLLPALCAARRSERTNGLIGVLERRFARYSRKSFLRGAQSKGGFVGSRLPSQSLDRISDRAWLAIVQNKRVPEDDASVHWRWADDHCEECSVEVFSRDMRRVARRFPERFGQLALRLPDTVHPSYKAALLDALRETEPREVPDDEKPAWMPAPVTLVEQVLLKFGDTRGRAFASSFCQLLHDRAEERWSDTALRQLMEYACHHPDPEEGKLSISNNHGNFDSAKATVQDLEMNALNSVRGVAALALGRQLWNHSELLDQFRATITRVCEDPHPAVKVAAVRACLPILNLDKDFAIDCLYRASADDLRVAASGGAVHFFNAGMQSHQERLMPLVTRMLKARQADVVEAGAEEVAARWLFQGYFAEELETCLQGSTAQRKGLAKVAAHFVAKPQHFANCRRLIEGLKDDPEKEVRQLLLPMVRSTDILRLPEGASLVRSFLGSQAFRDDPTGIIYSLEAHSGSLLPFSEVLFCMCEQFVGPLRDACRDSSQGILHDLSRFVPILSRLHEQAEEAKETQTVNRCLDAWDAMFERRVGVVHELARAIG